MSYAESNIDNNVTSSKKDDYVTLKGRYEVVGLGLNNRTELKGKRFDTVEKAKSLESTLISTNQCEEANYKWIICLNSKDAEVQISKEGKYIIK